MQKTIICEAIKNKRIEIPLKRLSLVFYQQLKISFLIVFTVFFPIFANAKISPLILEQKKAVVTIFIMEKGNTISTGSGFLISKNGMVATNYHVVDDVINKGAEAIIKLPNNSILIPKRFFAYDGQNDIALIQTNSKNTPFIKLETKQKPCEGDDVFVIGSPLGLEWSISNGIISSIRADGSIIQITAPISPGSSGSPVLNSNGLVIGIATMQMIKGQNLNFAISSKLLHNLYKNPRFIKSRNYAISTSSSQNDKSEFYSYYDAIYFAYHNKNKAIEILKYLANKDDLKAQYALGEIYMRGYCTDFPKMNTINSKKAFYWLERSAKNGYRESQVELGDIYADGELHKKQNLEKAFKWYKKAALQEDYSAQLSIGKMLANGEGVKRNLHQALYWFKKARYGNNDSRISEDYIIEILDYIKSHRGLSEVFNAGGFKTIYKILSTKKELTDEDIYILGHMRSQGFGTAKNDKIALNFYDVSYKINNVKAEYEIGRLWLYGFWGTDKNGKYKYYKNMNFGINTITSSAKKGYVIAQKELGHFYWINLNSSESLYWYKKAAKSADVASMMQLGHLYRNRFTIKGYENAIIWFEKAYKLGFKDAKIQLAKAMFDLYYSYSKGKVPTSGKKVKKDKKKALKWLKEAADYGYGMSDLGIYYLDRKDYDSALYWFKKAIEKGDGDCFSNIGVMYEYGSGLLKNYSKAAEYYKKAILTGKGFGAIKARCFLAELYASGKGVKKDLYKAKKLAELGFKRGEKKYCKFVWDAYRLYNVN